VERVQCVVVGAGWWVSPLRGSSASGGVREVLVLDSEGAFGRGTSSRNSEVMHAGFYYPPGSLKVRYGAPRVVLVVPPLLPCVLP